ncbi:MAG: hypothetical protein K8F91_11535 [Candidatus Obscuribacterales bacterium]|nr:hypothetical protein [Candidatus Obscuribacterales bacterium]
MALIDSEKLKALLDDFTEKEAVTREEINEIENQISELEQRIISSRERLLEVSKDIEKVEVMKSRYAGGDWSDVVATARSRHLNGSDQGAASSPAGKVEPDVSLIKVEQKIEPPVEPAPEPPARQAGFKEPAPPADNVPVLEVIPEPTLTPQPEPVQPQPQPQPQPQISQAPETAQAPNDSSGAEALFSFSHGSGSDADPSEPDAPWGPPSSMSWDQPPQAIDPQNPPQVFPGQEDPYQPQPPAAAPQVQPEVLTGAFDEEFDISQALGGKSKKDKANQAKQGDEPDDDNVKKINDALRGLFS